MELQSYFEPLRRESIDFLEGDFGLCLGSSLSTYWADGAFPSLENVTLALVGVCEDRGSVDNSGCAAAPDAVRRKLYRLVSPVDNLKMVDLGNILPGRSLDDTLFALTDVLYELMVKNITVVILGGSQDLTFAQYKVYEKLGRIVNMGAIDSRFDLNSTDRIDSSSYVFHIVKQDPNFLFNFTNIGYQSYFNAREMVELMDELKFDTYRLGAIQQGMRRAETLIRAVDMLSVDMSAVRQSDCPAHGNPSPHGFYGEELCQMARFAGMSDKLTTIGFYELNPRYDNHSQSAHMLAHALWYFIEGYFNRTYDFPYRDRENYRRYLVTLNPQNMGEAGESAIEGDFMHADVNQQEIVFIKSKKSERWWMEVPCEMDERRQRYMHHLLVPCTYEEYQQAMHNEVPELWMKYYIRVNEL